MVFAAGKQRLFAPEVIQSSMMDCGPASLKSLLEGFGIAVGYGRLREACSTDVDGTSIDTLEDVAVELGLAAEQVMVPVDHVLIRESDVLPAILVVQRPHAPTHFIVIWRVHGGLVQIMDPGVGRRWVSGASLLREVYRHQMAVSAEDWRDWAASESFQKPLMRRVSSLGLGAARSRELVAHAEQDPSWKALATLDAATRMLEKIASSGGIRRGAGMAAMLQRVCAAGVSATLIPDGFWSVRPAPPDEDGNERVLNRGAVLVRVGGVAGPDPDRTTETAVKLAPELLASLKAPASTAWGPFKTALRQAGVSVAGLLVPALAVAGATVLVQAVLLRSVLDLGHWLGIGEHRLGAVGVMAALFLAALLLDIPIALSLARLGRRLEVLLRLAFARKIPRIADHYFHSRLLSDMAERLHAIAMVRSLPVLVGTWVRTAFQLAFTAGGIIWLAPRLAPWVVAIIAVAMAGSWVSVSLLKEPEMRMRSHGGALIRFYLDALLGITSVRAHGAGASLMREQEGVLVHWADANRRLQLATVLVDALQSIAGGALAVALVMTHVAREGTTGSILLVTYWALQLPILAQSLAVAARQVPPIRNVLVRLLEPLDAPEETASDSEPATAAPLTTNSAAVATDAATEQAASSPGSALVAPARLQGVRVELADVAVRAGGHAVLENVSLTIEAGSQVAVVGESGAGKSTLVGLLLGWHRPGAGEIRLDGKPLTPGDLPTWRRRTAWVDPAVQLYNRRFVENLLYGSEGGVGEIAHAIDQADLREVLERLPEGLQTIMGEGGALVSGGEGQRVRLGRAWLRSDVRLVLLDEPFRGLDRDKRRLLLGRARRAWAGATMICVTHDVSDTLEFDRVVVIDGGRIVEDGAPRLLERTVGSKYESMLAAERSLHENMWASTDWRRVRVENGRVSEERRPSAHSNAVVPELAPSSEGALEAGDV